MKIELLFSAANKGKYMFKGEDLSNAASAMLDEAQQTFPDNEHYKLLRTELQKQKDPHYWTWERINYDWDISTDFAERLKPLDFVYPRTFTAKTKVGEAFIELFELADSVFLMHARTWIGTDKLRLEFIPCNLDTRRQLLADFYAGMVDF
ncbi:hypothetical protein [uncultured Draconibacterium sp.]|uniref:hypothetical protein n=1 Tax=uncultured Draconibacterium sp. TaxID=1573823 RepID=UPI0029C82954|nr:hypothetical protein [uncultured Draconibacterium sp.]